MGPHALESWGEVLHLCEVDLEPRLTRTGVDREDVDDEFGAVDDAEVERRFEVAYLRRSEIVVSDDHVGVVVFTALLELLDLSTTEVGARVRALAALPHTVNDARVSGARQLGEFVEHGEVQVIRRRRGADTDQDRTLDVLIRIRGDGTAATAFSRLTLVATAIRRVVTVFPVASQRFPLPHPARHGT